MDKRTITEVAKTVNQHVLYNPFPKAYPPKPKNIKAILLGCDPTNNASREMPNVFGIKSGNPKFNSFLETLESNLKEVGLTFDVVYSQNLCQNYFTVVTYNNPIWKIAAEIWIPVLIEDLKQFSNNIPVLLTSEILLEVFLLNEVKIYDAIDYYQCKVSIPIAPEENKLNRPLIPFYRNRRRTDYHLSNPDWMNYKTEIIKKLRINEDKSRR